MAPRVPEGLSWSSSKVSVALSLCQQSLAWLSLVQMLLLAKAWPTLTAAVWGGRKLLETAGTWIQLLCPVCLGAGDGAGLGSAGLGGNGMWEVQFGCIPPGRAPSIPHIRWVCATPQDGTAAQQQHRSCILLPWALFLGSAFFPPICSSVGWPPSASSKWQELEERHLC